MGKREENKVILRKKIVSTAMRLFASQGYKATTLVQIARESQVSVGTLYNYFNNKSDILLENLFQSSATLFSELDNNTEGTPLDRLLFVVRTVYRISTSDEHVANGLRILFDSPLRTMRPFNEKQEEIFAQIIEDGQREGFFSADFDSLQAAKIVHLITVDALDKGLHSPEGTDYLYELEYKINLVVQGLKA